MGGHRLLSDRPPGAAWAAAVGGRDQRGLLIALAILGLLAAAPATGAAAVFGKEPGGRTIGGPAETTVKNGSSRDLLTLLHRGPTPFRFICVTGLNEGPAILTMVFKSRIGETMTERLSAGEARVVCGETTGVAVECHGQGGDCTFRWRIDEPQ